MPLVPRTVDAFELLEDGTVALLVTTSDRVQHLVSGRLGVTPLVAQRLEGESRLFVASRDTLVVARIGRVPVREELTIRSWRVIEARASGAPTVGPELRPAQTIWRFAAGSLDGRSFIADVLTTPSTHAVAEVDLRTGAVKVRADSGTPRSGRPRPASMCSST